jgi:DNA-binding LacI/PurR family transcriptional regulator
MGHGSTLKDVAAAAGVSTSTVARVVHGNGYVATDTRRRVEAAMHDGKFRLNAIASQLKSARTMTIGSLLHETLPNPFFAEVSRGIEQGASERGYNVLLYNARGSAERERQGVEAFLSQRVDAIVFSTPLEAGNVELAHQAGAAVVEVERPLYGGGGSVLVDNHVGASAAMEHLIVLGHTAIGFIGEALQQAPTVESAAVERVVNERQAGHRDVLLRHGLPYDPSLVVAGDYSLDAGWQSLRTGRDYAERLLDGRPDITAIFAGSDLLAAGLLQALYARGRRVPDAASVIGFDDTFAQHLTPPLTTVRQPMFEMGQRAADLAIEMASATDAVKPREVWLQTELIVRDSTGPLAERKALPPRERKAPPPARGE